MKLRLAAIALILVGLGAVALALVGPSLAGSSSTKYITSPATVGVVRAQAVANGTIAASTVYGLRFGAQPDIVSSTGTTSSASSSSTGSSTGNGSSSVTWPVKTVTAVVGKQVKKGDVLATADASSAQLALTTAQATLASAQAKLATDEGGPNATAIASAKDAVNQAQNQYSQAVANRNITAQQNALSLSQAKSAVTTAQNQLNTDTTAKAPANVITQDQNALSQAKSQLASTQLKVDQSNQQAAQQVTSASLSVTAAQHQYSSKVAPADNATIQADKAQVASAQASVDSAQATVDGSTITAPADGLVVAVNVLPGVNAPSGYAIQMSILPMVATASFAETDVPNLKLGQAASVTISATKASLNGTVSEILPVAASSGGSSSVVTYTVTVTLPDAPASVLSGMSANVAITTAEAPSSVTVPAAALQGSASTGYAVQVMVNGSPETRNVQVGLVTSSLAQVTSGVSAGDEVVIGTTSNRNSTTTGGGTNVNNILGGAGAGGGQFRNGGLGR